MGTTKPISTISYNTEPFLKNVLNDLYDAKKIKFWCYIKHLAEEDEGGKKDHIHLFIIPNKIIDTEDVKSLFREVDILNPDKPPLSCMMFRNSKFDDWCMYAIHDKSYLASKGQSRKYSYTLDDVVSSDYDTFNCLYFEIDKSKLTPYADIIEAQSQGMYFSDYVAKGKVPLRDLYAYKLAWRLILSSSTFRNGKGGHDDFEEDKDKQLYEKFIDKNTGEMTFYNYFDE